MEEEINYWIWPEHPPTGGFEELPYGWGFQDCPRAGGGYLMTMEAARILNSELPTSVIEAMGEIETMSVTEKDKLRARLTTILIDKRRYGTLYPLVTPDLIEEAISKRPLAVHERADRLLRFIADEAETVGEMVMIFEDIPGPYAWSESTNWMEVDYFLNYLRQRGWVQDWTFGQYRVAVDGYYRIAEQATNVDSSQAFVAMWFDDSMAEVFETGIKPAIVEAGYSPLRIDRKDHINKIDDEIVAELRRSRFLVADFTHGDEGARGGVYYEAGFAHGLDLPVIFTCREDAIKSLHFDTSHYSHIFWSNPTELREKLRARILAVIGQGPGSHAIA